MYLTPSKLTSTHTIVDHQVTFFFPSTVSSRKKRRKKRRREGGLSSVQLVIWNEKKTRVNGTVKGLKAQSSFSSAPASQNKTRAGLRFTSVLPLSTCFSPFSPFPAVDTLIVKPPTPPLPQLQIVGPFRILLRWSIAWPSERWLQCDSWLMNGEWANDSVKLRITLDFMNRGEILFIYRVVTLKLWKRWRFWIKEEMNVE